MPGAKTAQLNLRLRPSDLQAIREEAEKDKVPTGPWCEQIILDRVHERRLPEPPAEPKTHKADPRNCPHERQSAPEFGFQDAECLDCGTKIRRVGIAAAR
jgi:hypothetical protein